MSIDWAEPPSSRMGGPTIFTPEVVAALKANRGRWACVARGHKYASAVSLYAARHPGFKGRSVKVADGYDLYARYIGEES